MMKKILIAGASGTAGSAIASTLVASRGYTVYALTHNEQNCSHLESTGCIPLLADLTDREQSLSVMRKVKPEIIISAVMGKGEKATDQEYEMGDNLIRISGELGVSTFVYLSVFQAENKSGVPHFEIKAEIEKKLKSVGLNYLIIRPATFMDGLFIPWFLQPVKEQQTLVSPMAINTTITYIHTRDIAALILYALQKCLTNETYIIGGRSLSVGDIQRILSEKMNTPINYQHLPLEKVKDLMGDDMAMMVEYFNHNDFVVEENALPADYKPLLRRFEKEIDQYL